MPKKLVITGGTKGIGLETAKIFLENGFEVITCASSEESVNKLKKDFPQIHVYQCNMKEKSECKNFADIIKRDFGKIDVLINNAGKFIPGQIHKEDEETFEDLMHLNLFSVYYLTRELLPGMIEARQGTVINICSTASITPYTNGGSYCISKYALLGFSKVLREEMKEYNIRVISVLPGATYTPSWEGVDLPVERFIPAEDIARVSWESYNLSPRTVVEEVLVRPMLGDLG